MKNFLIGAIALSFLLLCLDAVGFLPLAGFVEMGLKWVFGLSLVVGTLIFGEPFLRRVFGG